jgi:Tol biopolymer transport system component
VLLRPGVLRPVWSPDSRWIAFVTRVGRAEQQTWLASPEDTGLVRVGTGYAPAWSPDGRRIAFVVARVGDAQIYVMNADGSRLVRLTASGVNILPAWSPDGRWLAFLGSRDGDLDVWIMGADSSAQRRLAGAAGDLSMLPVVSWRPR